MARNEPTDEELLARYRSGDFSGFDLFYKRHQSLLMAFLRFRLRNQSDAEEAFQETFFNIHRAILRYDSSKKALPWIFAIARNASIDVARKRKRMVSDLDPDSVPTSPVAEIAHAAREELERLISRLSGDEANLIIRRLAFEESFESIATDQGTTPANVRQKVSRLIRKLKAQ